MKLAAIVASGLSLLLCFAGQFNEKTPFYKVLPGIVQDNLTVFPVTSDRAFDTSQFLTLDEGMRSGQITVEELGQTPGLMRRPAYNDGIWRERPLPIPNPNPGAEVNQLAIVNRSDRPLLLLAGEIVMGGKQDRVVGKDLIVPAHSDPIPLNVFCVEPHRWMGASAGFGGTASAIAQPGVRSKVMADRDQQEVWDQVARSRSAFAAGVPAPDALALRSSSSYAVALQNSAVSARVDSIAVPIDRSYEKMLPQLHAANAVGVVVALNGEVIWADVFASPALLEKYWTKLIRSYSAEALGPHILPLKSDNLSPQQRAQDFLNKLYGNHEDVVTEPGVYRTTEFQGSDFDVFILTSLLPKTGFQVHLAKMRL